MINRIHEAATILMQMIRSAATVQPYNNTTIKRIKERPNLNQRQRRKRKRQRSN